MIFRCEDDSQIRQRQTAIQRVDGYYGTFWCGKVNAPKYSHRIQVSQQVLLNFYDTIIINKYINASVLALMYNFIINDEE